MAKKTKPASAMLYSGRSGYSTYGTGMAFAPGAGRRATPIGEKTTVRSGAKSSKTYLTTSTHQNGSQSYMKPTGGMDNYMGKTNKKKPKGK